jgi:hypothetical protein
MMMAAVIETGVLFVHYHTHNEKSGARASGGVGVIVRMPGVKVMSRLSPCFAGSRGFFSLLFLARRIR